MTHDLARQVLDFWFGTAENYGKRHKRWFAKEPGFDAELRGRFAPLLAALAAGAHRDWLDEPRACLARILVLDQFPRQIHRGTAQAFATDSLALQAARHALGQHYDRDLLPVERLFAYLPFEHSESLADQELACELMQPLAQHAETEDVFRYALAHRDIIARFGRFPHRNAVLGRRSTAAEIEFLKQPGSAF